MAIPAKSNTCDDSLPVRVAIRKTRPNDASAKIKAMPVMPKMLFSIPITMAIAAPNEAPDEIPKTYGSAIGF